MSSLERLEDSVTGYGLWRKPTGAGGYEYFTDEVPCGYSFWNEALDNPIMVFEVLDREGSLNNWLKLYYEAKGKPKWEGAKIYG